MKKDCEECVKNDRNHHAEDCLYCMQYHASLETKTDAGDTPQFGPNLTSIKFSTNLQYPGDD